MMMNKRQRKAASKAASPARRVKVIFLDVDGVLNTTSTPNPRKLPYVVDKKLVRRFRQLVTKTRAKVVLISTWRYDPAGLFSARLHKIPFVDCTSDLPHRSRRDEILRWLKAHPEVGRYLVVDDDDDELDSLPLFQPSPRHGLTAPLARRIVAYLQGKTDDDVRRNSLVRIAENAVNVVAGHRG
jgi:hypothetical protein